MLYTYTIYSYDHPASKGCGETHAKKNYNKVIHGKLTIETDEPLDVYHGPVGRLGNNDGVPWYITKEG